MRQDVRRSGGAFGDRNVGQVRDVEMADRTDGEDHQAEQRDGGDHEHHLERLTDAGQMDADEQRVAAKYTHQPLRIPNSPNDST